MQKIKRVLFGSYIILMIMGMTGCSSHKNFNKGMEEKFSFGVIADCQYCNYPTAGVREYATSDAKLKACVADFNTMDLEYVVHLGDFIDRDWESFDVVGPIYDALKMPKYHVLGNHDFSVPVDRRAEVYKKMGMPSRYYDFAVRGWRFVVLDGNDVSFHAYAEGSEEYKFAQRYYEENKISSPKWNGAIGESQKKWLISVLEKAEKNRENVILYSHFPVFPENVHNLWNADEIIKIIENYPVVKAYLNGHNHEGNYGIKNGVHYLTMKGMVDTKETAYGVITIENSFLKVQGYGREGKKVLELKKK